MELDALEAAEKIIGRKPAAHDIEFRFWKPTQNDWIDLLQEPGQSFHIRLITHAANIKNRPHFSETISKLKFTERFIFINIGNDMGIPSFVQTNYLFPIFLRAEESSS